MSLKLYNSSYKLGEICLQITDGKHGDCENQENSGYYFVSVKDIDDGEINYSNARQITKFDFEDTDRRTKLENEDILITNSGTIGKFVFVNSPLSRKTTFQKSVAIIKPNKNKIIPKFLYYYLISEKRQLVEYAGGTTQKNLLLRDIRNFEVKIPDESRQKKIIMILNDIDQLISVNKKLNKNLLSIADAIYKKEFQNFDSYSEDELITSDFGLIPKNWCYKTLDEISDVAIGKTPPRKETWCFSEQEGVKWVSIKDLGNSGTYIFETSEYLTKEAIEKFNVKLIPKDTVILSFKLTVGRIGITTEEMVTNEAIAHFKLTENSVITKEYLYLYLKNFNYEELGSTSSIAKAINSKIVKKISILIPNNKINEFKDLFENIFDKIKSNQLEINKLTKLRDTLLPKLMSGEIDVSKINCDLE